MSFWRFLALEKNKKTSLIERDIRISVLRLKLLLSVLPTLVNSSSDLYQVENEYNAIEINSENIGLQLYKGKGAGSLPTGPALRCLLLLLAMPSDNARQFI